MKFGVMGLHWNLLATFTSHRIDSAIPSLYESSDEVTDFVERLIITWHATFIRSVFLCGD